MGNDSNMGKYDKVNTEADGQAESKNPSEDQAKERLLKNQESVDEAQYAHEVADAEVQEGLYELDDLDFEIVWHETSPEPGPSRPAKTGRSRSKKSKSDKSKSDKPITDRPISKQNKQTKPANDDSGKGDKAIAKQPKETAHRNSAPPILENPFDDTTCPAPNVAPPGYTNNQPSESARIPAPTTENKTLSNSTQQIPSASTQQAPGSSMQQAPRSSTQVPSPSTQQATTNSTQRTPSTTQPVPTQTSQSTPNPTGQESQEGADENKEGGGGGSFIFGFIVGVLIMIWHYRSKNNQNNCPEPDTLFVTVTETLFQAVATATSDAVDDASAVRYYTAMAIPDS